MTKSIAPIDPAMRSSRGCDEDADIQAGSWWRVLPVSTSEDGDRQDASAAEKARNDILGQSFRDGFEMPEHGLVLMVQSVRSVDGAIHSVVLHPHPCWVTQSRRILLIEDFLLIAAHVANGADLRALEEAAFRGYFGQITEQMSAPLDEAEVEARMLEAPEKRIEKTQSEGEGPEALSSDERALVPRFLLPGRDVQTAEARLRREIALNEARSALLAERVQRMSEGAGTLAQFQEEKVATAQAGIASQMEKAETLLSNVHSMRLWLGQGVSTKLLVDGPPAAGDGPVHFMQQLLFLDEEIFVERMAQRGFDADDLADLSDIFSQNPSIVQRILPFERCVTITRVRRRHRDLDTPNNISEALCAIEKAQQDKLIQIFV